MTLHTPVFVQPVAGDSNFPNGIPFTAQELRRNMQALLAASSPVTQSGVTVLDGQYAVTQHAAGANFSVDVAAGHAFVAGTDIANQSVYGCWNDGTVNVPTPTAPASGTEVHRLVLQIEDRYSNGVWTGYTANLNLLADTGSGTPAQPASAITLALISVSAGQASVLNANITDQRPVLSTAKSAVKNAATHYSNTTTLANDPDLVLPVAPNAVYEAVLRLFYTGGPTGTSDLKASIVAPAGTSWAFQQLGYNGAGNDLERLSWTTGSTPFIFGTEGAATGRAVTVAGNVSTAGTPGSFQWQFAQNTAYAAVDTIVGVLSSFALKRIG